MPTGLGALAKASVAVCSAWGEAWGSPTLYAIPIVSENITRDQDLIDIPILQGTSGMRKPEQGVIRAGQSFETTLDYNNCGLLIKALMGAESGGVYTMDQDRDFMLKMVIDRTVSRVFVSSFKVTGGEISCGGINEAIKLRLDIVAEDVTRSQTAMGAETFTDLRPVLPAHGILRIANLDDALATGDRVSFSAFSLRWQFNMKTDSYGTVESGHADARKIFEPEPDGMRSLELQVTQPKHVSDTFADFKDAFTSLQADFVFTHPTSAETFVVELPQLVISQGFDAPTPGPQIRNNSGTFRAYLNDDNTHMSGITNECRITNT